MATLSLLLAGCSPSGERALIEGDHLLQTGKATEAIPLLERAVQDLPQNAPALNHLGLAYHATGKTNEARRAYLRALEVDRNRIEAAYNLAITHLERGELLEAEKGLRAYLFAHPGDPAVWSLLANLQFQAGRWDDAERSFAAVQPPQAMGADGWNTRGLLSLRKRRFSEAVKCLQYALVLDPTATTPLFNLGVTHQLQGDRRSAAAYYRRWLASAPPNSQSAAVQELIRQWEAPPTPPAGLAVTNGPVIPPQIPQKSLRPSSPTTPPTPSTPAPRTNAVAEATRPPAPPATTVPPPPTRTPETPPPAPVAPPQLTPPPPLQVVNVQEDPPLRPAQDEPAVKPAPQPTPTAAPAAGVTASAQAKPTQQPQQSEASAASTTPPPDANDGSTAAKRSLWQRVTPGKWVNPVQWFRKESGTNTQETTSVKPAAPAPGPAPAPAPAPSTSPAAGPVSPSPKKATPLSAPAAVIPQPAPRAEIARPVRVARPAPPRYVRRAVGPLPAGNRAAAESVFQQATAAHQRRDLVSAAAQYRRATELDPSFHEAFHNLALVAIDQGDLNLALLACEQALLVKPSDAETRRNFAVALKQSGHPQDAAEQIELFLAAKPSDTAFHLAAAGLYAGELDDPAKARTHYESVLALEPSHPQAAAIRGWLASHPR